MFLKVLSSVPSLLGLRTPPQRAVGVALFNVIAAASRQPVFYEDYEVPDTVEGRFDVVILHVLAALERLAPHDKSGVYGQALFDAMTSNLDANLRQMGVGDTRVGRRVREFAEMFYGRANAYREALSAEEHEPLTQAIGRNVYGDPDAPYAAKLAEYLRESVKPLEDDATGLLAGDISFPSPDVRPDVRNES